MFERILKLFTILNYAAADDKATPPANLILNQGATSVMEGLVGTTKFKNVLGVGLFPWSDSVGGAKKAVVIFTRSSPETDTDYASLPIGSVCIQLVHTSLAVTDAKFWLKTASARWVEFAGKNIECVSDVTLTSAQVKALKATPITLVAAPGTDLAIVPTAINIVVNYAGTNAFTEAADDLSICYATSPTEILEIESTGLIDQTNDENRFISFASVLVETFIPLENQAVVITNLDDEIAGNAGNDNTVNVRLWYKIVPVDGY